MRPRRKSRILTAESRFARTALLISWHRNDPWDVLPRSICTCWREYDTSYIHELRGTWADNWWGRETRVDNRRAQQNIYFCVLPLATDQRSSDLLSFDTKYGAVCQNKKHSPGTEASTNRIGYYCWLLLSCHSSSINASYLNLSHKYKHSFHVNLRWNRH
jgi:hypothetical protein